MATIRSQMVLNDGISAVLKKITSALDTTLASFEQMRQASGNAMDVADIEAARAALAEAGRAVDEMADNYRLAAQEEERLNQGIRNGTSAMDGMLNKAKSLAVAIAGAAGIQKAISLSDQMTSTRARLSLIADDTRALNSIDSVAAQAEALPDVGFAISVDNTGAPGAYDAISEKAAGIADTGAVVTVDDGGSVELLERKIMASAQRSRASYLDTANAIASMGANAGATFSGNDELIAFMEQVNKQFVIGGATAQGQAAAMTQLTQAMAAGALRGEELNSILENAPGIARAIETYMGAAEGSIKQYAEQGLITAEVVKNALFYAADETNAKFESMPMTWGQIWTNMQNRALAIFDPILKKINQVANSEQLGAAINGVMNGLALVASVAGAVLDLLINLGEAAVNNWSVLEPIVMGVAAAFLLYNGYLAVTNGLQLAHNIQTGISAVRAYAAAAASLTLSAAERAEAMSTAAATAAQYGFNAALLASPVTWIVVAVIALVAAIMALCAWIAKTTGVAQTGFGVLTGGINVVIQAVVNAGLVVANIALGIWNALGAVCSNIGAAFHNVIANVQSWFYGLLSTALTVVAGICEALNKLPFVEFDYSGITSKADEYAAKSDEAAGSKEEYTSIGDAFSEGFGTFDAYSEGWASDAFQAGAAWGDGVADKAGGMVGGLMDPSGGLSDAANGLTMDSFAIDELGQDVGAIAENTGGMAGALEVSGEELKYLRDIAERDAINRFTTAEVKVDFSGMTNRIDSNMDLDGVIRELTDGFSEALATAAEGVHT